MTSLTVFWSLRTFSQHCGVLDQSPVRSFDGQSAEHGDMDQNLNSHVVPHQKRRKPRRTPQTNVIKKQSESIKITDEQNQFATLKPSRVDRFRGWKRNTNRT
eukprot:2209955-Amphidinium_carterae.1